MKKSQINNPGLKLLAFVFAFLLWFTVVNIDDPVSSKTYRDIPVTVQSVEVLSRNQKTYQIMDGTNEVNVTVSARRSVLEKIKAEDIIATADLRELYLETQIPVKVYIPKYEEDYTSAVVSPRNLQVRIENNTSKTFPITAAATGTVRDGYVLGEVKADPEKVTINGAESSLEKISKVTAEVDVSGLAEDTELESSLVLYDADNNVLSQSLFTNNLGKFGVSVKVSLYRTKTVSLAFDESAVEIASGYSLKGFSYTPEEITVAGKDEVLEDLDRIHIPAEALEGDPVSRKTEKTIDITPYLPEGVELIDENANNVLVTISVEKNGTGNFDLPVGSIAVNHLNEDLRLTYDDSSDLEVQVRGAREILDTLDIEKAASIDLKEYDSPGVYTVPVKLDLPLGCILENELKVRITLEEKEVTIESSDDLNGG